MGSGKWSTNVYDAAARFRASTGASAFAYSDGGASRVHAGLTAVRLGVVRCYMTRHGPGPFVTEDPTLEIPEPHNQNGAWQGAFRTGHFDAVALRYAVEVSGGVDAVALTHLDVAARHPLRMCRSYQVGGQRQTRILPGPERDGLPRCCCVRARCTNAPARTGRTWSKTCWARRSRSGRTGRPVDAR